MIGELRKGIMIGESLQLEFMYMLKPSLVVQLLAPDNAPSFDILRYVHTYYEHQSVGMYIWDGKGLLMVCVHTKALWTQMF